MLVVTCGLQGSGKSAAARIIARRLQGTLLIADVIRKELYPQPTYALEEMQAVYDEMFDRAGKVLKAAGAVVLDATFARIKSRVRARDLARQHKTRYLLVKIEAPDEIVRQRLMARTNDPSDADFSVYLKFKHIFQPVSENHPVINNSGSLADLEQRIDTLFTRT